ncbi:TPA: hypothetical protein ACG1T0_003583 [Enterobacter hormaechei]|uniref:hypothetical protein n=1 Tax=Enterobacter hormaechei TaxID=158836 RepID=UPI0018A9A9B8|nr:hypothetical protein [Enterobacter hormaechei]EKK5500985.1 hypothetical protein [Enterobacter hormaechei]MCM7745506.1 hypothetical protein [Enterobacter hormaechei]
MFAVNKKYLNVVSFLTIAICLLYVFLSVIYKDITDDHFFSTALEKYSLHDILQIRYLTWSGRVVIEAFLMKTINIVYFPQIIIVLSCMLTSYCIAKFSSKDGIVSVSLLCAALVLLLSDFHTNRQATLWITGAYNYIIPISIGMYSILIALENNPSILKKCLSCVLIFLACNNEQFAVTAFIGMLFCFSLKFKRNGLSVYDTLFSTSLVCGGAIVLTAPGNVIRLHSEIVNWMPDFTDYSIFYKLSVGVDRISNQINSHDNFLFFITCVSSVAFLIKGKDFCLVKAAMMSILSIKALTFLLSFYPDTMLSRAIRFEDYISSATWRYPIVYITYFTNLLALSSILLTCMLASKNIKDATLISMVMLCGVLSALMIGFSPTAYASGTRVMFLFDVSIAIGALFIFNRINDEDQEEAVH